MAHNIVDVDAFTSAVTVPDGGDPRTAASVELPFQAVSNRTRNNKNRLDALANAVNVTNGDVRAFSDFEYCSAAGAAVTKPRTLMIPLSQAATAPGWVSAAGGLQATLASAQVEIPLPVQTGCIVTMVRVAYLNSSAPGTPPGFAVIRKVADKATPGIGVQNTERADTNGTPGTTSATPQLMSTGVFSSTVVNLATEEWYVRVQGRQVGDVVYWVELTMSDPGPRNF